MAGFYVDLDGSGRVVLCPADLSAETIADDLRTTAQVVEMLLIKNHSRVKVEATTSYDVNFEQQHRLLPISQPVGCAAACQASRNGDCLKAAEA